MGYLEELKRINRNDWRAAAPLFLGGIIILAIFAFLALSSLLMTAQSYKIDPSFASDLRDEVHQLLELLSIIGWCMAYGIASYSMAWCIAAVERRHVRRLLARSGLLLRLALLGDDRRQYPRVRHSCWEGILMDRPASIKLFGGAKPRSGSVAQALNDVVEHFDTWCRLIHESSHPRLFNAAMFTVIAIGPLSILALVGIVNGMHMHLIRALPMKSLELVIQWEAIVVFHLLSFTLPAGRRIGIRWALIDYFSAEDPAALCK
jgi:hypothetical protein